MTVHSELRSGRIERARHKIGQTELPKFEEQNVSDFVPTAPQEAAQHSVKAAQPLRLSLDDQRAFAEAVANPFQPNEALVRSADAYRNLIKESR